MGPEKPYPPPSEGESGGAGARRAPAGVPKDRSEGTSVPKVGREKLTSNTRNRDAVVSSCTQGGQPFIEKWDGGKCSAASAAAHIARQIKFVHNQLFRGGKSHLRRNCRQGATACAESSSLYRGSSLVKGKVGPSSLVPAPLSYYIVIWIWTRGAQS